MLRRLLVTLAVAGTAAVAVMLLLAPQHGVFVVRDLPFALAAGLIAAVLAWWSLADGS
jgi:hypothetical protein